MEHSERKELEIFIVLAAKTYHRTANYGKVVGDFSKLQNICKCMGMVFYAGRPE